MDPPIRLLDDGHPGYVFGEWDAPVTDEDVRIPTPVGTTCMHCRETIEPQDNGRITPIGYVQHRECSLRSVLGGIGHLVDHEHYCHGELGPDAGLEFRASALLVWNWFTETRMTPTPEQTERWRAQLNLLLGLHGQ